MSYKYLEESSVDSNMGFSSEETWTHGKTVESKTIGEGHGVDSSRKKGLQTCNMKVHKSKNKHKDRQKEKADLKSWNLLLTDPSDVRLKGWDMECVKIILHV